MNCDDARAAMLEADPAELRGEGGGELARHLAACEGCRSVAHHLLAAAADLDAALTGMAERAASRARVPRARDRAAWMASGLAAAAVIALVALTLRPHPAAPPAAAAARARPVMVGVEVPASSRQSVAVFATDDPKITIIWLYND